MILEVAVGNEDQFFRPCMDRRTTTSSCSLDYPESAALPGHVAWMTRTWDNSFPRIPHLGYPWTRLGSVC